WVGQEAPCRACYGRGGEISVCSLTPFRSVVFFFQAEDGIRDRNVTGVQTCALPIYGIATLISLVWIILTIIWAFRARAALQQYALTQFRFELKMNPVWTFLFHIFYINYCINTMPESLAKHRIIYGEPDSRPRDNSPQ